MRHIILTKHAVSAYGTLPTADWVDDRRRLLVNVTARSLIEQQRHGFEWWILAAPEYADQESDLLRELLPTDLSFRVVTVQSPKGTDPDWSRVVGPIVQDTVVATTILDSDDALAPEFCAHLYDLIPTTPLPSIVDFPRGVVIDVERGFVLRRRYARSAFQTLVEEVPAGDFAESVLSKGHHILADHFAYRREHSQVPMWFMTVHGTNIANQAWGVPVSDSVVPSALRSTLGLPRRSALQRSFYSLAMVSRYVRFVARNRAPVGRVRGWMRHLGLVS